MNSINLSVRINKEIDTLKMKGCVFCPAELAKKLNTTAKKITAVARERGDVRRVQKAHARRFSPTTICSSVEPMYYPSVWGFI